MEALLTLYWLASVLALTAAAVPICARLFQRFPDNGAALAPGVAFATLALVAYWVGHVRWGAGVAALSVLSVFALGAAAARTAELPDRRAVIGPLAVFVAAFAFFVAVRAVDPSVHAAGGEKFLDFALLKSIFLAESLPPEDPWFAGKRVRYYYGGILSISAFAQAIDVAPRYAYNFGLATCYAALTTGAYGVAAAVADHRDRSTVLAGLLAVFFVGLAGPLATPVRVLLGFLPYDLVYEYGRAAVAGIRAPLADAFATATHLDQWNAWIARYVVPDTITVTPMWSYLNGDLHAHVIAPIFLVPAIGVAFEGWRATDPRRRAVLLLGVLPVFAGALAITSTWSLPTAAGIGFLALALADPHPASLLPERAAQRVPTAADARGELSRYALAAGGGLVVGLVGAAFAAPFLLFQAPPNEGIGWLPPRSPLAPYLLAYGTFVAIFVAYLARCAALDARRAALLTLAAGALVAVAVTQTAGAAALLLVLLGAAWYLRRTDRAGFAAVLVVAGAGLLLVVEFAYAKVWPHDPRAPRWNTVYKVSMQVAVIWGLGAAIAAASLLEPAVERARAVVADTTPTLSRADWAGVVVAVLVVLSAATFPALALKAHFDDPPYEPKDATLDATDFVEDYHPQEAEAFEWLRTNVDGQPTMLTAGAEPMYTWLNAPTVFTGIPAVLGWRHEKGYRPDPVYEERRDDVRFMYRGDQRTQALLFDKYDVQYVYYGPVERERYPNATFGGPGVDLVYKNERVSIYRVDADAACAAANITCIAD